MGAEEKNPLSGGKFPDDELWYQAYVRQKIGRGLEDIETGRLLSEEDFDRRFARWLESPS